MAQEVCKPIVLGNGAMQDIFNTCINYRINSLETITNFPNKDYSYYKVVAATYAIGVNDHVIGVKYTDTAPVDLTLPAISIAGKIKLIIKDEGGKAGSNKITVTTSGGDTFEDGPDTDIELKKNKIAISLYNDGIDKWFIYGGA